MTFHVLMACHNRRELTVRAVLSALDAASNAGVEVDFTVFDDGSTDGTSEALLAMGVTIHVIAGDGSAFWAQSMSRAEEYVLARNDLGANDVLVWVNDDIVIDSTAFAVFSESSSNSMDSVFIGAMRDPATGQTTYGGYHKTGVHPLRFSAAYPGEHSLPIDTFNGNLVFVPLGAARHVGGIDGGFSHAFADIDYGLRCRRLGIPVYLLPGTLGNCPRNPPEASYNTRVRWRRFVGVKGGGHFHSIRRITRKGAPNIWFFYVGATYTLWWIRTLLSSVRSSRA